MNGKELGKRFRDAGWSLNHVTGSHHIYTKGEQTVSIPVHGAKDLKKGTLHSLLKILDTPEPKPAAVEEKKNGNDKKN